MDKRTAVLYRCFPPDITATDLKDWAHHPEAECYRVEIRDAHDAPHPELASLVYFPEIERGGMAWGGDAVWGDAPSAEEVCTLYLSGELEGT